MEKDLTQVEENYIKAIFALYTILNKPVSTNDVAAKIQTKASSVTDMIKKLSEKGLVHYVKYQGVSLTEDGMLVAMQVVRKHRLWEVFLVKYLGFKWDEVHEVAEQLEHVKSEKLIDGIDALLDFPQYDPHGDPIPDKYGNIKNHRNTVLSQLKEGEAGVLVGVKDSSEPFLQYLDNAHIQLGMQIQLLRKEAFDQSVVISINGQEKTLSSLISNNLYIKK